MDCLKAVTKGKKATQDDLNKIFWKIIDNDELIQRNYS